VSFDLFVGCFANGEKATFPRALVERHFGAYVTRRQPNFVTLTFGEDGQSYLYVDDAPTIDGFSIERPVHSAKLYEALLAVLRSGNLVLYMPGNCPPLVAHAEVGKHLPTGMIESLGAPVVLSSASDIPQRIQEA
jgi:hypothetical protein